MRERINTILIANRGEIALRVMRTCRRMGITTVAVFSDADAGAPFVRNACRAVRIGPAPSVESYLQIDRIIAAAEATGADAIHPGYGFLAENTAFASACEDAGIVFIGPSPEVIALLGSKQASKRRVEEAGVPVIPGYQGDDQSADLLAAKAAEIGFPVLIKASAGGGGKGMRIAREAGEVGDAIAAAKREALSSFGDDTLLIERYIENPRHVEIQILGDAYGKVVHLFERECSIQRRHQKIIEESPSTALDPELRSRMGAAAVKVAEAVGYQNAGTVELILAPDGEFFFLEVNTRLQVEHPVTEMITGLDLVREQIRVARKEPLGYEQSDLEIRGAAVECRLYAEDADAGFLPTTGTISAWHIPEIDGLRVDAGIEAGSEIGIHYDPMVAKVICHGASREEATDRMVFALQRLVVSGITSNRDLLIRVLQHPAYRAGELDTHFLERHAESLARPEIDEAVIRGSAVAATLFDHERRRAARAVLPQVPSGWRNNRSQNEWTEYRLGDDVIRVEYHALGGGRFHIEVGGHASSVSLVDATDAIVIEDAQGIRRRYRISTAGARVFVHSIDAQLAFTPVPRFPEREAEAVAGACVAPMPGKIIQVLVSEGQAVSAGDTLVILEAMKMEHAVKAGEDGVVASISVSEGDQVDADALLAVVTASE